MIQPLPNIEEIVTPLIGTPYAEMNCWTLVRHVMKEGFGIELEEDPENAHQLVTEVWWCEDECAALDILQPWDFIVLAVSKRVSTHVGIALDATRFVHTRRRIGCCIEPTAPWQHKMVQIVRLRQLLE